MIYGDKKRKVARYLPAGNRATGWLSIVPGPGQEFWGCPWGWVDDHSPPFVEVVRDGKVIKTVNALHLAEIDFAHEPENPKP